MTDIDDELRAELDRIHVPQLESRIEQRVTEPRFADAGEPAAPPWSRFAAAAITLAVFGTAAVFARTAFRPSSGPGEDGSSVVFPTWTGDEVPLAIVLGKLRERDGCLVLDTGHSQHLVLWERSYRYGNGSILDEGGDVVVRVGDPMRGGGGYGDSRSWAEEITETSIPDRCIPPGPESFVLVYDVSAVEAVVVPEVVGLGRDEAIEVLRETGLEGGGTGGGAGDGVVLSQSPAAGTSVGIGSVVWFVVGQGQPTVDEVRLGTLPDAGIAVTTRDRVDLIELDGSIIRSLPGFEIAGNPGADGIWLRTGNHHYALDADRGVLTPVPTSVARGSMYDEGPSPELPGPVSLEGTALDGHWRYVIPSGDVTLAQWSGECEFPTAYWIGPSGEAEIVTGGADPSNAQASMALGWSPDGAALVFVRSGSCGSGAPHPGIYAYSAPGEGRVLYEPTALQPWSLADAWGTGL